MEWKEWGERVRDNLGKAISILKTKAIGENKMMERTIWLILLGILIILITTRNYFWVSIGIILFVAYSLTITTQKAGKKTKKAFSKGKKEFEKEIEEMDKTSSKGKKLSGVFEEGGKTLMDYIGKYQTPKGAKNAKQVQSSYQWGMEKPVEKTAEASQKFLEGLKKFFDVK